MTPILLTIATFFSTLIGGIIGIRNHHLVHRILGFTAGVILGVIAFDILPETFDIVYKNNLSITPVMVALVLGFLLFHISEKFLLIHHAHDHQAHEDPAQAAQHDKNLHPQVGILAALALSGHSFLDGVGIGLGFQVNTQVGIAVAIAVIGHDFADGLNTVSLMLNHKNKPAAAFRLLLVDALAPVLGVLSTRLFHLTETGLALYLGFFAGFLLYIGAADILPQANTGRPSRLTLLLTVAGTAVIYIVTRVGH